jgi:hypothetical protein
MKAEIKYVELATAQRVAIRKARVCGTPFSIHLIRAVGGKRLFTVRRADSYLGGFTANWITTYNPTEATA